MHIQSLIAHLASLAQSLNGPRFVGVTYRSKGTGELARHVLIIGASYANCLADSLTEIKAMLPSLQGLDLEAGQAIAANLALSIASHAQGQTNPNYTQAGKWVSICAGLRVDELTGQTQLTGLAHSKTVLEAGREETDTRKPLTRAKDSIRAKLKIGKFRTLSVEPAALESVRIGGSELEVT